MRQEFQNVFSAFRAFDGRKFDPVVSDTARHYAELDESAAKEAWSDSIKADLGRKFSQNLFDASGWLDDAEARLCEIQQAAFDGNDRLCAILVREMFRDFKEAWLEKEAAEVMRPGWKQDVFNSGLL